MGQRGHLKGNKKCIELNENGNVIYQNLWDKVKAVLREKFIALNVHIRKEEKSQTNHLSSHLENLIFLICF